MPGVYDQKIITFGGPDRCGKTSIAKELAYRLSIPYFKPTGQREIAMKYPDVFQHETRWGESKLYDFLKQTGYSIIMDRGYPCDWVYSKVLGRETAWDSIEALDHDYSLLHAINVFTVRRSYRGRQDDAWKKIDEGKLVNLHEMYVKYSQLAITPTLLLWVDDEDLDRQCDAIIKFMKEH